MIADSWRARWPQIIPFLALPADLRRAVYATNSMENFNRQIRKTIKTRGHFPDEQAATKLIYLAIQRSERKWLKAYNWTGAVRASRSTSETDSPTNQQHPMSPRPHTQKTGHPPPILADPRKYRDHRSRR
jgi:transposase-like protein